MAIALIDSTGHIVMLHKLDNTQYGSIAVAEDKAPRALLPAPKQAVRAPLECGISPRRRWQKLSEPSTSRAPGWERPASAALPEASTDPGIPFGTPMAAVPFPWCRWLTVGVRFHLWPSPPAPDCIPGRSRTDSETSLHIVDQE